jgi:hypothetical protein
MDAFILGELEDEQQGQVDEQEAMSSTARAASDGRMIRDGFMRSGCGGILNGCCGV